jgi:hypothetical protein
MKMKIRHRFVLIDAPLVVLLAALVATCVGAAAIRRMSDSGATRAVESG